MTPVPQVTWGRGAEQVSDTIIFSLPRATMPKAEIWLGHARILGCNRVYAPTPTPSLAQVQGSDQSPRAAPHGAGCGNVVLSKLGSIRSCSESGRGETEMPRADPPREHLGERTS